jgi:hypothetical protein
VKWWLRWRRHSNGTAAKAAAESAARLRSARRDTPVIEAMAKRLADLPDDEFAARVSDAFRRRHA